MCARCTHLAYVFTVSDIAAITLLRTVSYAPKTKRH